MHNYGDAPQRDGWSFSYWSLDQDGTRPVTQLWFDTYEKRTGNAAENVELYAQWTRETASVTAVVDPTIGSYLNGEIGEKTIMTGAPGSKTLINVATPPYKHTFSDWGRSSLGGGAPAVPPTPPHHSGYVFAGYDSDAWQKVAADGTVRILYDWDAIEVPETGSSGMLVFLVGIILTCIVAAAATTLILRKTTFQRAKMRSESDDCD